MNKSKSVTCHFPITQTKICFYQAFTHHTASREILWIQNREPSGSCHCLWYYFDLLCWVFTNGYSAGQSEREQLWWRLCCCHSPSLIQHPAVWSVDSLDSLHMVLKSRKHCDVCGVVSSCHGYRNSLYILEQSFQAALQKYHFLSVVLYRYLYKHAYTVKSN